MFIELTDHLRCPRDHDEAFLVLLPDRMAARRVIAGHLGCPVCGWSTAWTESVPDFGDAWSSAGAPPFDAVAAHAMLGIDGPGGWVALGGNSGALMHDLAPLLAGVSLVAINPPESAERDDDVSVIRGAAWPLKSHAMRGVILGSDVPADWMDHAVATTLPGLRTVGVGDTPPVRRAETLAHAGGVWVVRAR